MRAVMFLLAAAACGGSSVPETADTPPNTCDDLQAAAQEKLGAVLAAHGTCQTDADCTTVAFGASCFDACSRVIATSGQSEYDQAVIELDRAECHQFAQQGCPSPVSPPCVPPADPHCNAGICE